MKVVYTAIIGSQYDDLKEPTIVSPGWRYVCFTDQPLTSKVWEIRQVLSDGDPQRTARGIKIIGFKEWQYSLWLDAAFQINIDLNGFWDAQFRTPFTSPRHPLRHCVYHEIDACIANNRGDARQLLAQKAAYALDGVPHHGNNIITSGVLMRENTAGCMQLCDEWLREVEAWSVRDQVAFGRVSIGKEFHTFNWDYSQSKELLHHKHNHLKGK